MWLHAINMYSALLLMYIAHKLMVSNANYIDVGYTETELHIRD